MSVGASGQQKRNIDKDIPEKYASWFFLSNVNRWIACFFWNMAYSLAILVKWNSIRWQVVIVGLYGLTEANMLRQFVKAKCFKK